MAALAQEVARSTPEIKSAFEQGLEKFFPLRVRTGKKPSFGQPR